MELFGMEGTKQTQYVFSGASLNDLRMSGSCGIKGWHVIVEDMSVALWPGRGDATHLHEPGISIIIALFFHWLPFLMYKKGPSWSNPCHGSKR